MGPPRFELELPAPQAGRMPSYPTGPIAEVCIIIFIQKLILIVLERFNIICLMKCNLWLTMHR